MAESVSVKICGITRASDADRAIALGARWLGFNFYRGSPRYVQPGSAGPMIDRLPSRVDGVGVFVNEALSEVCRIGRETGIGWVQCHGDEDADFCRAVRDAGFRVIKAFRVRGREDVDRARAFEIDAVLFDAFHAQAYGGTGQSFDWQWLAAFDRPVFLAGGLSPDNIAEAAGTGVDVLDVCSGVEASPGRKDPEKLRLLFEKLNA